MRYKNGPKLNFFLMPITFIIHHQKFDCNKCQFFLLWALYITVIHVGYSFWVYLTWFSLISGLGEWPWKPFSWIRLRADDGDLNSLTVVNMKIFMQIKFFQSIVLELILIVLTFICDFSAQYLSNSILRAMSNFYSWGLQFLALFNLI